MHTDPASQVLQGKERAWNSPSKNQENHRTWSWATSAYQECINLLFSGTVEFPPSSPLPSFFTDQISLQTALFLAVYLIRLGRKFKAPGSALWTGSLFPGTHHRWGPTISTPGKAGRSCSFYSIERTALPYFLPGLRFQSWSQLPQTTPGFRLPSFTLHPLAFPFATFLHFMLLHSLIFPNDDDLPIRCSTPACCSQPWKTLKLALHSNVWLSCWTDVMEPTAILLLLIFKQGRLMWYVAHLLCVLKLICIALIWCCFQELVFAFYKYRNIYSQEFQEYHY